MTRIMGFLEYGHTLGASPPIAHPRDLCGYTIYLKQAPAGTFESCHHLRGLRERGKTSGHHTMLITS